MSTSPTRLTSPPPVYDSLSNSHSTLKPYLELPHLLSLTWLAYPVLSLFFVAFRLQSSLASAQNDLASVKNDILASCKAAEHAATAAASLPRYLASSTNRQFVEAVNGSLKGAREALIIALTSMEAIINFVVDTYRSTFLCFVELVVRGGLAVLIGAVQELQTFVQTTADNLRTSIQNDVATANSAIQSAFSALNKVNPFGDATAPQFNIPSLSSLQNVSLPTDFEDALIALNNTLPTFSELKEKVTALLDTPFELLKKDINDTFAGITFNESILPVPQQNTLSFCDQLDVSVVDDLGRDLIKIVQIGTVILIALALLLVAGNCALEWFKWRCLKLHLERTRRAWVSDPTLYHTGSISAPQITLSDHNLLMLRAASAHPLLTIIINKLSAYLRLSAVQHTHLQWFFHYIFHPPALVCFLIGFFGLLSVQIQLIAVSPLAAKFSHIVAASIADFSNVIVTSVNDNMFNQSSLYANDINGRVDAIQTTLNNGVFSWVNETTTTLNSTLNEFYNDIQSIVTTVFNGTVLENPAQDFIRCIIGSKVDALENALTFLNQNIKVNIPRVSDTLLVLTPGEVNEATQPIAQAALGGGHDNKEGFIGRLVDAYTRTLKKERFIFSIFLAIWGVVVVMALMILLWQTCGKSMMAARGRRKWSREQRSHFSSIVVPFRGQSPVADKMTVVDLPSFTPMPSPGLGLSEIGHPAKSEQSDTRVEKNWDNGFFEGTTVPPKASRGITKPKKLLAIGRKPLVERFVPDEKVEKEPVSTQQVKTPWFSRFASLAGGKASTNKEMTEDKTVPVLRIDIDRASSIKLGGVFDAESNTRDERPSSTWSISPPAVPRPLPWTNILVPTKKPHNQHDLPLREKFRPTASVPSSVNSIYEDAPIHVVEKSYNPSPLAIPLHFGFERADEGPPTPQSRANPALHTTLAPPPDRHRRLSSVSPTTTHESPMPLRRLLTTTHARHSSSVNPFATPFDDEYSVETPHSNWSGNPTNPFTFAL